ncbi:MAG TPA: TonB family protein [Terriglobales bacterium]|nr:TonB family protein [Terriglobales bacterium]
MPPLSLLFSSNEETSRVLIQALRELEFQVEHCPEIFAAVQRLTGSKLDVIVADWDDGLEASFLLKTSRELKSNSNAFTAAIVSTNEAEMAARKMGADCILKKSFSTEQMKYALLSCDAFLARMREWLPRILADEQKRLRNASPASSPSSPEEARPQNPLPDTSHRPANHLAGGPASVLWRYSQRAKRSSRARANRFLIAAIITSLIAGTHAFDGSRGLKRLTGTSAAALQRLARNLGNWGTKSETAQATVSVVEESPNDGTSSIAEKGIRIRVTPVRHTVGEIAERQKVRDSDDSFLSAAELKSVEQLPSIPRPTIPESLRTTEPSLRPSSAAVSAALLDALEPVTITEELSENLLLEKVQPKYPEQAVRSGLQGSVVLQALIGTDGRIQNLKLVQGSFLLGQSAYQAVKQWRYRPYSMNGRAVQAQTFVTVDFSLPTRSSANLPSSR